MSYFAVDIPAFFQFADTLHNEKELHLHRSSSFSLFLIGWSDTRDIIHYCPYSTALPQNFVHRYRGNKLPQNDETVWLLWSGPAAGASITPGSGCRCSLLGPQTRETNTANTILYITWTVRYPDPLRPTFPASYGHTRR